MNTVSNINTPQSRPDLPRPADELPPEGDNRCPARSTRTALKKFDRDYFYAPKEAVTHAKATATAEFDENLDVVSGSASIPARPTRWSVAPWRCRPAPART